MFTIKFLITFSPLSPLEFQSVKLQYVSLKSKYGIQLGLSAVT